MSNIPDPTEVADKVTDAGDKLFNRPQQALLGLLFAIIIALAVWIWEIKDNGTSRNDKDLTDWKQMYFDEKRQNDELNHELLVKNGVIKEQGEDIQAAKVVIDSATSVRNNTTQNFHSAAAPMVRKLLKNR